MIELLRGYLIFALIVASNGLGPKGTLTRRSLITHGSRRSIRKSLLILGSVDPNYVGDIPTPDMDFSLKVAPETFVENSNHILELDPTELHPPPPIPQLADYLDLPMASPPIEDDAQIDDEHQVLYLKAQHAEVVRYSSEGWFWVIASLDKSKILRRITKHMAAVMSWAGILTMLHAKGHLRPFLVRDPGPINLLFAQLSLLLVFRTNSAYERMWHSRGMLEELVNSSRQVAIRLRRALHSAAMGPDRTAFLRDRYVALLGVLPKLLLAHAAYAPEGKKIVSDARLSYDDQRAILEASNTPLRCIQLMRESLEDLPSRSIDLAQVDSIFDRLIGIIGGAEKIVRTPVPKSYSRHTSRFLTLALLYYPLVLLPTLGVLTLPTMLFFCWALMGIEEIGHIIENSWEPEVRNDIMNTEHIVDIIEKDIKDIMTFGGRKAY
jgi:predicted membrane chloride channel (bestrophin family)